jgi:CTD kinase subunit beta
MLESERKRVLSIERLVLETMCFKFRVDTAFGVVIKLAKALGCRFNGSLRRCEKLTRAVSKELTQRSWRVAVDW